MLEGTLPVYWSDLRDLSIGHAGQAREHVTQVSKGINVMAETALDHGIQYCAAFPGVRIAQTWLLLTYICAREDFARHPIRSRARR